MTIDIHLYANGNDPFTFSLGEYIVHVHSGASPGDPSVPERPAAPGATSTETVFVTPRLIAYPTKTPVNPPIALTYVHEAAEILPWLNEVGLERGHEGARFRLDTVSGPDRPEVQTLLEDLQSFGARGVHVDIVGWSEPTDA